MKKMVPPFASNVRDLANYTLPHHRLGSKRQNGAVAVMFAASLVTIIGFFGLALDLSRIYNRKVEMQGTADTIALAAAQKLNGKSNGISNALAAAQDIMQVGNYRPRYNYTQTMNWSDAAIKFGRSVNGSTVWLDAAEAASSPNDVIYVKVDTNALDAAYTRVDMMFMPVVSSALTSVSVGHAAVAGRRRLNVTPLAICAMADARQAPRTNQAGNTELVEYGFRRGVSYDLMKLIRNGSTNFLVDPIAKPGAGSSPSNFALSTVGRYVCTGTVALPKVSDASVSVQAGFPLPLLFNHLNSRFDLYNGACNPNAAPPDTNVKQYTAAPTIAIGWMSPIPTLQNAKPAPVDGTRFQTIADIPSGTQPAGQYGPLWAYARAVPGAAVGLSEPAAGYTPFPATQTIWNALYPTGQVLSGYPVGATATPYSVGGAFAQVPSIAHRPGIKNRRVLNIPLLVCPVSGSVATVLGIGKFFMTVPADANIISAEFAGLASDHQLGGPVEIIQ